MIRQLVYWIVSGLTLLGMTLVALVAWLGLTTNGAQILIQWVPGLTVHGFQGQLASQWQAKQLKWQGQGLTVQIDNLTFNWQARCLVDKKICIEHLTLSHINFVSEPTTQTVSSQPAFTWSSLRLPTIQLPHLDLLEMTGLKGVEINQLSLGRLEWNGQEQLTNLQLTANWQATLINLTNLEAQSPWLNSVLAAKGTNTSKVKLNGWLLTQANWPLELHLTSELSDYPLQLDLAGDFAKLQVQTHLTLPKAEEPSNLSLKGWVNLLQTTAPLDLTLAWQNLNPSKTHPHLVEGLGELHLQEGEITLKGDLKAGWLLAMESQQQLNDQPIALNLSSNLSWQKLKLENLLIRLGKASWLQLELELAETAENDFNLAGKLEGHLITELLEPTLFSSKINASLASNALTSEPIYQLRLPKFELLTGQDKLTLELNLDPEIWQAALQLEVANLTVLTQAVVKVIGRYLPELVASSQAEEGLEKLQQLAGDVKLSASATLPALPLSQTLASQQLIKLTSQGEYQLNLAANHLNLPAIELEKTQLQFSYSGLENNHNPKLGLQLTSKKMTGSAKENELEEALVLEAFHLQLAGLLTQHQLTSRLKINQQPLEISLEGGVKLSDLDSFSWHYQLVTLGSEVFKPWLPEDLRWTAKLDGELKGAWQNQQLQASLELNSGPGELAIKLEDTLNQTFSWVPLTYHLFNLVLSLDNKQLHTSLTLDGDQLGYFTTQVNLALEPNELNQQRAIKGNFQLAGLELQLFSPFVELDKLAGKLMGQGEVRGHLLAPEFWGSLQLENVEAANTPWPVTLKRLDGELLLQGQKMRLNADITTHEGGQGQLTGEMQWQQALTAQLRLKGDNFQVRIEPFARLQVTPDLTFSYQEQNFLLAGQVQIPSGLISVQQLPKQAIKVSEDVQVVGRDPLTGHGSKLDLNIELLLGNANQPNKPPLKLEALGLNAEVQGRLRVSKALQTRGELLLVKGSYQSWGQDLKLRKARLNFAGPVSLPFLDIEAVREVDDLVVGIHLTGRVDNPEANIFSEPSMANEQALSWLILGRPLRTEKDENTLNAAAISYGLKQASGVTGRLGESLGLKDFQLIAEGGGSETSVVASGYLNDRLSVSYGVGIYDEVSRFVVRYDLTRKVYIEAASSLASSLDIFWRLKF